MQHEYKTRGVCASKILFDLDGDTVKNIRFVGGCNGNTQGVSRLVIGMTAEEAVKRLKGINCNGKGTSCPDQLAKAIEQSMGK